MLTLGTQAPKDDLRLLHGKSVRGGGFQTGGRANGAVHIGSSSAAAADKMMVVVSDPRFVAGRVTGRLNTPNEARPLQRMQIVVDGLRGKCAETGAGRVRNRFGVKMLSDTLNRGKHGEAGGGHAQARYAQGLVKGGVVGRHAPIITPFLE